MPELHGGGDGFGEDDEQARGVLLRVEQRGQLPLEGLELRVLLDPLRIPTRAEAAEDALVTLQQLDVCRPKILTAVFGILSALVPSLLVEVIDLSAQRRHGLLEGGMGAQLAIDIDVRADEEGVVAPHTDHVLRVLPQVMERLAEGACGAFEPLDEALLHEPSQLLGYIARRTTAAALVFLRMGGIGEVFNGAIAGIGQSVLILLSGGDEAHRVVEKADLRAVHDVFQSRRPHDLGKDEPLRLHIFPVIRLHVGAGATHHDVHKHFGADLFGESLEPFGALILEHRTVFVDQLLIFCMDFLEEGI